MTRKRRYRCEICMRSLVSFMKPIRWFTADELRAHLREVHTCMPDRVIEVMVW
jgi:hypothetical protein